VAGRAVGRIREQWAGYLSLFLVVAGGTAYAADTIGSSDVINESLLSEDIKNGQVRSGDLATNQVLSAEVRDDNLSNGGLESVDIASDALQANDLGPDSVNQTEVASNAIDQDEIEDSSVGAAEIGTGAVGGAEILNRAVTPNEISGIPAVRANTPGKVVESAGCIGAGHDVPGSGAASPIQFVAEDFDIGNMHATGDCNTGSRVVAPRSGIYQVSAGVVWPSGAGGTTRTLAVRVNGTASREYAASRVPSSASAARQSVSTLIFLNLNDFVQAVVTQDSGTTITIDEAPEASHLAMHWVGPNP
jgi:hypothetical protein